MTKLTLSIDTDIVEKAKRIADANNTSVSAMFSQFVQSMASPSPQAEPLGPLTRKLSGIIKLPHGKDYKQLLTESLMSRHGVAE